MPTEEDICDSPTKKKSSRFKMLDFSKSAKPKKEEKINKDDVNDVVMNVLGRRFSKINSRYIKAPK